MRVSCVITVYNGERHLGEALASVLGQDYRDFECIVVDDGSTDATPQVVGASAHEVRYVRQENGGHACALNRGVRQARGELVAFLDHDDRWLPHKLARQVREFDARPGLDACFAHAHNFLDPGQPVPPDTSGLKIGKPVPAGVPGTLMARRSLFDAAGLFDERLSHAHGPDWLQRVRELGAGVAVLPDVLLERRVHGASLSQRNAGASLSEFLGLVRRRVQWARDA